jgi:hypothetical protein
MRRAPKSSRCLRLATVAAVSARPVAVFAARPVAVFSARPVAAFAAHPVVAFAAYPVVVFAAHPVAAPAGAAVSVAAAAAGDGALGADEVAAGVWADAAVAGGASSSSRAETKVAPRSSDPNNRRC